MNPSAIPNPNQPRQPNTLERLLPTVGGIAGGFIGGALGGAGGVGAGALVPGADLTGAPEVVGGITGAKVGSTAGAGIGGGLGQAAEDFLTHNLNGGSAARIGGSALENAIGQGVGHLIAGAGGTVINGVKGLLGNAAAGRAETAAVDTAAQAAATKANAYRNNYGSLSDRLQRDLNLGTNAKTVDAMGFDSTNPADMKTVSNAGLDLNSVYDSALKSAKPVDMSGFGTKVFADMQKNGITDLGTTPLGKAISEAKIPLDQKNLQLPATQVRQLQQAVGTQIGNTQRIINNAELQGVSNTEAESQLKALQDTYKDLGARIKTPEVNQAIASATVSDADRAALVDKYGDKLGNTVADTINNAQNADHLLKPMQSYTQMSHAADMATSDIENAIGTARAVARTKADIPSAPPPAAQPGIGIRLLDTLGLGSIPFTHGATAPLLLPHAVQALKSPNVQDAALAGLEKVTGSAASKVIPALVRSGTIAASNLPNEVAQPVNQSAIPSTSQNVGGTAGGTNALDQTYQGQQAIQGNLLSQEQEAPAVLGPALSGAISGLGGVVAGLAPQVQKQEMAGSALSSVMPGFENAGGAQGPLGGLLSEATAIIPGSPANTYAREQATAAATLASLLGISPAEAMGLLPRLTQSQGTSAVPQNAFHGILGGISNHPTSAIPAQ